MVSCIFGIFTPIWISVDSLFVKHLTTPKGGNFEPQTLTFQAAIVANTLIQILAVSWYWKYIAEFNLNLFLIGILASISDNIGIA